MENMVINRGNPRQVSVTVLGTNGVKIELSKCTDVELILWINGRSKRASNTQILNDILVAELTPSELDYLGEYSAQVKYTDNGVVNTSERVYLFRVANEFYRTSSGTGLSDGGTLEISVSTPQAINKGYSAYEIAVQNGYVGTEKEWLASLSQESKDAAAVAYDAAQSALNKAQLANDAAINANSAAASVNSAKDSAIQAATSANSAASSANAAKDSANSAATNANEKADLANTAALNADVAKVNAEKATADANTATLNATNAANNANAKAVYANEQGDYAKQQGLNAVATANEAAINANNAAFNASQQAAYAKQQGDYAKTEAEGIDAKIATKANQSDLVQLEQNVNLFNRRPQGLRFKAQDNTVFAKTMKALALGTDDFTVCVVARTEGCESFNYPLIGFSKATGAVSGIKFYKTNSSGSNGYGWLHFEYPITGDPTANSINLFKTDNTTNLHHIVITRSGTLVTCTINGRLVKSVTQERVLDFLNFTFDIANTQWFWGGCVTNYAMTQVESNRLLWNGGRYNEVSSDNYKTIYKPVSFANYRTGSASVTLTDVGNGFVRVNNSTNGDVYLSSTDNKSNLKIEITNNSSSKLALNTYAIWSSTITLLPNETKVFITKKTESTFVHFYPKSGDDFSVRVTSNVYECRLNYRPENIRSDRYLNSGTAGSDYDLVYSQASPEIVFDKPYQDKVMLDENKAPDWHPIAIGQEVETPTNIFKAKLPTLGAEWSVSDWKQINN